MARHPHVAPQVRVVPLGPDRRDDLLAVDQWAFAFDDSERDPEFGLLGLEWARTAGAEVGRELAGVHSAYSLDLPVPGGEVPAAGLTWVGVHPQFRRRGVLRAMMDDHLRGVRDAGREPVSALWAAEPAIYGRFGYGLASTGLTMTLARGAAMVDVPGAEELVVTMERADPDRHTASVQHVFDRVRARRPGMVSRPGGLAHKVLADPPHTRHGAESLRLLLVFDAGGDPRGYALFRRKSSWGDGRPDGEVQVQEVNAVDAAAARAVWGRLVDLDLMSRVATDVRPTDDALLHLLVDVRAARPRLWDGLWVRLVDVRDALQRRRYTGDVDVVLDVRDAVCPWNEGRWRLRGGPHGATCEPTRDDADLALDVAALGSAYLGGPTLHALASAGRVRELVPGALDAASVAFGGTVAPYCGWTF